MVDCRTGNLLDVQVEALVNPVNCVGVMGKGLALQFKQRFPDNYHRYSRACQNHEVNIGEMFAVRVTGHSPLQYILNFPTKRHWRDVSLLEDIRAGLDALVETIRQLQIQSIAIPALGCGNGGLAWRDVEPLILSAGARMPDVSVLLFPPQHA